jgi:hypothetical protein
VLISPSVAQVGSGPRLIGGFLVNQREGGRRSGTAAGRTLQVMQRFSDSGVPIMGQMLAQTGS